MEKLDKTTEQGSLANTEFSWDSNETFFGKAPIEEEPTEPPVVFGEVIDEDEDGISATKDSKASAKKSTESKKEDEDDSEDEDEDNTKIEKKSAADTTFEDEGEESDGKFFKQLATEFKERGIFAHVDIPDKEELEEDEIFELTDAEVEARVDETFQTFFEELDEDGKDFLKFKRSGGSTSQFFSIYQQSNNLSGLDMEEEADREVFLRGHYAAEGLAIDDIEDRISWHKEHQNLEKYAKKYYAKEKAADDARKQALLERQADLDREAAENRKKFIQNLKTTVSSVNEIGGMPITKEDKDGMVDFFVKPAVKVGNNRYLTEFQSKLNEIMGDSQKMLLLGKLLRNDFDLSEVKIQGKKEKVKEIKSTLRKYKSGAKGTASSSAGRGRSLADLIS